MRKAELIKLELEQFGRLVDRISDADRDAAWFIAYNKDEKDDLGKIDDVKAHEAFRAEISREMQKCYEDLRKTLKRINSFAYNRGLLTKVDGAISDVPMDLINGLKDENDF